MSESDLQSRNQLLAICQRELLFRRVVRVYWKGFSDTLGLSFENSTAEKVALSLGYLHWVLVEEKSNQQIASSQESFETFRVPVERLKGTRINRLDIRLEAGLSLTVFFDNGVYLYFEACEQFEDDVPCWELFCSDGSVVIVGMQLGKWHVQSKDLPYQYPSSIP